MDLPAAAKDVRAVLGLLAALCRGAPHDNQQVQHFPPASTNGRYDTGSSGAGPERDASDGDAVSLLCELLFRELLSSGALWPRTS